MTLTIIYIILKYVKTFINEFELKINYVKYQTQIILMINKSQREVYNIIKM